MAGQSITLDAVDRKMIALLQKDGRITTQALARAVGVSDVTAQIVVAASIRSRSGMSHPKSSASNSSAPGSR